MNKQIYVKLERGVLTTLAIYLFIPSMYVSNAIKSRCFELTNRHFVRQVLAQLDPIGVELRRRRKLRRRMYHNPGPLHVIHIDGYDKVIFSTFCFVTHNLFIIV